jgi:RNA polymerase-interacting CarD/CdnL/TRCF family regulator
VPSSLKDASINEKQMYMQRKKIMFQEMASSIRLSISGAAAASILAVELASYLLQTFVWIRNGYQIR